MPFTLSQQQSLLAQKGIGTTILKRLQEMGLDDVKLLAKTDPTFILERGAELTGSTCWRNSPQARKAIETAVNWAKTQCDVTTGK
ncbi:TPA: recombinase RecA [Pasteurella multocida]